ncbi:hypothetical protein LRH25_31025 [Ideonella azotifigens]|uniref:Polysaccharide biosynthesis enzyme WcbI domain-containing protein n=1 Tax=Ideonella azotifigens TaxID=513160 RepID=A0ABN1KLM5_9BURK|nr:WcbI family polysaccharide biosynthesis putative acetyltransferase [Ideonella azotifigens]MCD2344758.1 hypothetical protein [Ideonella azotifigens]
MPDAELKIAVVGNCQARPLAQYLGQLSSRVTVHSVAVVHLLKDADESVYTPEFEAADLILAQQVADGYPCGFVTTSALQARYGGKLRSWINLYYAGYNPELTYIRPSTGGALHGPLGDYHHRFIFEGWKSGQSVAECEQRCLDVALHGKRFADAAEAPWPELERREATADVKILDYLREHVLRSRLFHTMNHPTRQLLLELATRVLKLEGLAVDGVGPGAAEPLGQFRLPVNPFVRASQAPGFDGPDHYRGLAVQEEGGRIIGFKGPHEYALAALIEGFYRLYDQRAEVLKNARIR